MSAPKRNDVKEETPENPRVSRRRLVPLNQTERHAGEPASSSRGERRSGTPLPSRRDYPSRETSADTNVTSENTRRRERSMSYGREARQPFRDWASLITSEELERAKERIHLDRKWDYALMCAMYKITGVVDQENTLTVGTREYQELIEGFGKLIAACVRHSILMHVEDASTNLAELVAVSKVGKKFNLFEKKAYQILEPAAFRTDPLIKGVFDTKSAEMETRDFDIFCKLCSFVSPLAHTLFRYNDTEKQRYQVGLLPGNAEDPLTLLMSHDWFGPGWDYLQIHAYLRDKLENLECLPCRVSLRALQGHSERVRHTGIMQPIVHRSDMKNDRLYFHGTFFRAWTIMDPTQERRVSPSHPEYKFYGWLRMEGGPGNTRTSRLLHFLPENILNSQPQAMRRNCDVLLVFLETDLWSLSQDASADQNFDDMAANNGEDSGLPDTIWRAGNGVVCCNFDIELSKNLAGAYDVRRKQWLMSELNLENEAKEAVDSYTSHWHHHNPDAGLRPHQENPPARDRSASRPPGSRSGPSAQRDSRWQQRQAEHSERFRSQTPGRERSFRARERTPPARTTQQTRWTNRRPTEPDEEPENRARPQAKRRLSPHFGQARSRENTPAPTRRTPVSLTPRQDVPRSRPQSRARFDDHSEEQDYNPDSPPNHVARSRSPSTASRGGILRTPRASQQNTARTTQRTAASPRRTTRENTPGRSQTPRRQPREPDHPPPENDDPYVHGFRFRNSPPEVLQWWRSRATPSDQELRNPRLFEKPERDECLCELCARQTAFHCSLCDLITCSRCRVDYHCDCSTRWLNLGSSLMRNTFQDVREFVYNDSGTPFDTYELFEEHKEIIKTIVNDSVKRFKKLKDDVRERRTTSGSGELDRILRQDIGLDDACYGVYGEPDDPLPSAEEHFKQSQVPHGLPVLRFAGLDAVGRDSRPGEKNAVLEILRCFFVDPSARGRTRENASRTQADTMKVEFGLFNWGEAIQSGTVFPADIHTRSLPVQDYLEDTDVRTYLMCKNGSHVVGCLEAYRVEHIAPIVEDHAMFGICIKSSDSGAPPILCLVRGDSTTSLELQRVYDLDKNGVDFTARNADRSSWFFFATTYRIIWGLKSHTGNTLVDTMPMKADGLRMTTSEHDEAFAEQEQQSDESEPPRFVDHNADHLAPLRESCLLRHSGPEENTRDYSSILEKDTDQLKDLRSLNQETPDLQGTMAEYRPGRPLHDVLRWGMPEFRVQFFHINSSLCKTRHSTLREIFCNLFWTALAIDKVDLITGDSNQAGQLVKSGAPLADYNNSLLVQCMEAVVTKLNEQCPPVERVTFQVISNTKAKEYVKMMEAQKWTKESECDGLVAFSIVYGFKQDSIQKIRSLDEYATDQTYRGPAKAMECTFFSKERAKYLAPIDVGIRQSSTDWHVPLLGHIGAFALETGRRRKLKSARPAAKDKGKAAADYRPKGQEKGRYVKGKGKYTDAKGKAKGKYADYRYKGKGW